MMHLTLEKKIALTHDVFELHYKLPETKSMLPGQFITFILPGIGGRSYSVLDLNQDIAILIIKKWESSDGGRGGSIALCDAQIGDAFKAVGPAGHFTLSEGDISRCFLGTGTGFVPLYNQILGSLNRGDASTLHLVFGVRTQEDLFYTAQLEELSKKYSNFSYTLYLSREKTENTQKGYVTDYLSREVAGGFEEFYMCGAPGMIESCEKELLGLGVHEEKIFFEKYN